MGPVSRGRWGVRIVCLSLCALVRRLGPRAQGSLHWAPELAGLRRVTLITAALTGRLRIARRTFQSGSKNNRAGIGGASLTR